MKKSKYFYFSILFILMYISYFFVTKEMFQYVFLLLSITYSLVVLYDMILGKLTYRKPNFSELIIESVMLIIFFLSLPNMLIRKYLIVFIVFIVFYVLKIFFVENLDGNGSD
ncbi:membrane hypothetical protein [Tenacibaculum sediminilitoris]